MSLAASLIAGDSETVALFGRQPVRDELLDAQAPLDDSIRNELVDVLRRELASLSSDDDREDALDRLANGADVIVAGQQPGLLGGPLLTLWKAATAIKLANARTKAGRKTVAIFWNASEDHDLDEANRFFHMGDDGSVRLRHADLQRRGIALEHTEFDESSLADLRALFDSVPWEFPRVGETFGRAMTRFIATAFAGTGLLVLEPSWVRDITARLAREALQRVDESRRAFMEGCDRVERAGHSLQLARPAADWTGLFHTTSAGRLPIRERAGQWFVGDSPVALEELVGSPDISFSAALRPLAQRFVLPVAAQICGPGEIAYLAQLAPLFDVLLGKLLPLVWPRSGGVVLRREERNAVIVLGFDDAMLLQPPGEWPPRDEPLPPEWKAKLDELDQTLRAAMEVNGDNRLDGLLSSARHAGRKLVKDARKTLEKDVRQRNRPRTTARHRLEQVLWPRGKPQERCLSAASLEVDPVLIAREMIAAIDPWNHERIVLDLAENES